MEDSMTFEKYLEEYRRYQKLYMGSPFHVHIETTSRCNARCVFCPHSKMGRKNRVMPDELFEKIICDLEKLPRGFLLSPFKVGEPFLDPKFFDRLDELAGRLPKAHFTLTTNLSVLRPGMLERLAEVPRLEFIWVSLTSIDTDDYKRLIGLNLQRTIDNIHTLLAYHNRTPVAKKIIIGRVSVDDKRQEFYNGVEREFSEGGYSISTLVKGSWCGQVLSEAEIPQLPCARWFEISICCDGKVALCCMDGLCDYQIGDVNEQSVLDIYNSEYYAQLRRKSPARQLVKPCDNCAFL
jgi:hypothetical protein